MSGTLEQNNAHISEWIIIFIHIELFFMNTSLNVFQCFLVSKLVLFLLFLLIHQCAVYFSFLVASFCSFPRLRYSR